MGRRYGRSVSSLHLNFGSSILAGFLVGLINKECSMSANRYILDEKVPICYQKLSPICQYFSTILLMLWFQCIYRIMILFALFYRNQKLEKKCTFMIMRILFYQNSCLVDGMQHLKIKLNIIVLKMVELLRFVIGHSLCRIDLYGSQPEQRWSDHP